MASSSRTSNQPGRLIQDCREKVDMIAQKLDKMDRKIDQIIAMLASLSPRLDIEVSNPPPTTIPSPGADTDSPQDSTPEHSIGRPRKQKFSFEHRPKVSQDPPILPRTHLRVPKNRALYLDASPWRLRRRSGIPPNPRKGTQRKNLSLAPLSPGRPRAPTVLSRRKATSKAIRHLGHDQDTDPAAREVVGIGLEPGLFVQGDGLDESDRR
ncbi:MAG: hypothetical protein Q9210_006825 [Variospora velana]